MPKAARQEQTEDDAPVHPAAHLGARAVKLFEEIVEQTTLRKRPGKTIEQLVDAGLVYDRHAGWDEYGQEILSLSARIDAWDAYSAYLDHIENLDNDPDAEAEPTAPRM